MHAIAYLEFNRCQSIPNGTSDLSNNSVLTATEFVRPTVVRWALLLPESARRQLNDLPDDLWTKINIEFYKDAAYAVFKSLEE